MTGGSSTRERTTNACAQRLLPQTGKGRRRNWMRRENAYILELCRFQDADPERLRDWMAQGLDYPYILGHLLFNRMGERRTTPFRMPASFPRSTGNSAARWRRSMSRTGCAPAVTAAFSASLEGCSGTRRFHTPSSRAAAGQPVSGRAAHLKRHGHPHSGTDIPALSDRLRESGFEQGVLRAGRFRPATGRRSSLPG